MKLMKRMDAARAGEKLYFTGKPCKNGHLEHRYTSTGICVACNREYSANYQSAVKQVLREARAEMEEKV
jgi:glutamate dehydrogenase/leucine dehydrogenase